MSACRDNFYKKLVLYIHDLCSCLHCGSSGQRSDAKTLNKHNFIDVKTKKSASLLTQNHQGNGLMTPLKLICMAGSQPLAVFLLGPGEGDNTKPANRMGPLRGRAAGGGAAISWPNLTHPDHVRDIP